MITCGREANEIRERGQAREDTRLRRTGILEEVSVYVHLEEMLIGIRN